MQDAVRRHDALMRAAIAAHDGYADDGGVISQGADFAASRLGAGGAQVPAATPRQGFGD